MRGSSLPYSLIIAVLGGLVLLGLFVYGNSLASSSLISSILLCSVCLAMVLGRRGIRLSFASPLSVFPAIYLLSLGLPSFQVALGVARDELFFQPEHVSAVNYYATGSMLLFLFGYLLPGWQIAKLEARRPHPAILLAPVSPDPVARRTEGTARDPAEGIYASLVCALSSIAIAAHVYHVGPEQIWASDVPRGSAQWNPWGIENYLYQLKYACLLLSTLTAGAIRASNARLRLWIAPCCFAIFLALGGSRAAILPFVLFLLASEVGGKRVAWKRLALVAGLAFILMAYITAHRPSTVGLSSYIESLTQIYGRLETIDPLAGVSSLGPTTAAFWIGHSTTYSDAMGQLWRALTPLPSFIVRQDREVTNVVPHMGIFGGSLGVPFPVIAELYFLFGWAGMLFGLLSGFVTGLSYQKCKQAQMQAVGSGLFWSLLYCACVFAGIMSVHSGLRTTTRLPIWAVLWYFCFTRLGRMVMAFHAALGEGKRQTMLEAGVEGPRSNSVVGKVSLGR